jgi:imidazolonepropionase-like amidohydrolase
VSAFRTIGKWILRIAILAFVVAAISWIAIHASRAYYSRQAQRPASAFIVHNEPVIALEHARLIDGTGAPALEDQTIVIAAGIIAGIGPSSSLGAPQGAAVIDLTGKTVYPGLVMMHEHLFTIDPDSFPKLRTAVDAGVSAPLMYFAAGVTTARTAGAMFLAGDEAAKRAIDSGLRAGPDIVLTAPYLESAPTEFPQMHTLATPDEARTAVDAGVARGIT